MGKLEDIRKKTSEMQEKGDQVVETGETKVKEAEEFKSALDGLDIIDEDARAILDSATQGAIDVANEQSDTAIKTPMETVSDGLTEVSAEADEYSSIEKSNADTVSDAVGDYASVGSQTEASFEQRASDFDNSGESAELVRDEFKEQASDLSNLLESLF